MLLIVESRFGSDTFPGLVQVYIYRHVSRLLYCKECNRTQKVKQYSDYCDLNLYGLGAKKLQLSCKPCQFLYIMYITPPHKVSIAKISPCIRAAAVVPECQLY